MSANDWLAVDNVLGYAEPVLVAVAIVGLARALLRGGRWRTLRAVLLAVIVGITVAQPFGVKGVPISPQEFAADDPQPANAESIHSVELLGLPLFGFRPYTREIQYLNGEGGYPDTWLKVRSWLWPGLLTNAEKLERLCGTTRQPCWVPEDQNQTGFGRAGNLELVRADGQWRYRILTPDGSPPRYPGESTGVYAYNGYYRLTIGIVSTPGLVYWLLAGVLGLGIFLRLRSGTLQSWKTPSGAEQSLNAARVP